MGRSGVPLRTRMRSPSFRAKNFSTCTRSPTARGSSHASLYVMGRCCLLVSELDRHLEIGPVSQLNTWPVVSPVNASRRPSRDAVHHLGSGAVGYSLPHGGPSPPILCQQNWRTQLRSGRIEARIGLRMMPTFPRSPLSFRTVSFPQYGWKAGFQARPSRRVNQLKPAPDMR
jgi:hypothetical protein